MITRSIVSKLFSSFLVSLIISVFFIITYSESDGVYFSLFFPTYFIVFAFTCIIALPISIFIDKVMISITSISKVYLKVLIYFAFGSISFGIITMLLVLIGFNIDRILITYGLSTLYLFFIFDMLLGILENKVRMTNNL
jgi:hypothetical protein